MVRIEFVGNWCRRWALEYALSTGFLVVVGPDCAILHANPNDWVCILLRWAASFAALGGIHGKVALWALNHAPPRGPVGKGHPVARIGAVEDTAASNIISIIIGRDRACISAHVCMVVCPVVLRTDTGANFIVDVAEGEVGLTTEDAPSVGLIRGEVAGRTIVNALLIRIRPVAGLTGTGVHAALCAIVSRLRARAGRDATVIGGIAVEALIDWAHKHTSLRDGVGETVLAVDGGGAG
jgi:hypothetical protein